MYPRLRLQQIHATAFIAPGATVIDDVSMGPGCSIWFGAVLRGDSDAIQLGSRTNVQDNAVLHTDPGLVCSLGNGVTVGHGAIVHGATIEDNVTIGMGSIIMNRARIGRDSIVAAGAIVTEGTDIPSGSLVIGVPGKVRRPTTAEEIEHNRHAAEVYYLRGQAYRQAGIYGDLKSFLFPQRSSSSRPGTAATRRHNLRPRPFRNARLAR